MDDFKAMEHQAEVIHKAQFMDDVFLAFDLGTGKTFTTIQLIRDRCAERGALQKVLVIAPLITLKNWSVEIGRFSNIHKDSVCVLKGSAKKRAKQVNALKDRAGIIITNYESFDSSILAQELYQWRPDILVCDEAHLLKNSKSKRARTIAILADKCKNRYLLTGTPILNSPMDLFMPFRILDGHLGLKSTFGKNFFAFRGTYFEDANASWAGTKNHFPNWVPREATYEELSKRISKKTFKADKNLCLTLPPLVVENKYTVLSAEQNKAYQELKKDFITYVKELSKEGMKQAVVARLAITKALRLQQITTGFVKTDKEEIITFKSNPRLALLKDLLLDITPNHKVIVWAVYKENYKQIKGVCEELKLQFTEIHGGIKTTDKFDNMEVFDKDPKCRVLIANQASGGVGVNLTAASYSIYYSRSYKLGDEIQSTGRNYRKGSEIHDKITKINIICQGTIDELIIRALENKQKLADIILNATDTF